MGEVESTLDFIARHVTPIQPIAGLTAVFRLSNH